MRKNTPRHIIHAVLDCLPIILIPIFMVYSQNHEISGSSITRVEETVENVDFNQLVVNGKPTSLDTWTSHQNCLLKYEYNSIVCYDSQSTSNYGLKTTLNSSNRIGHTILVRFSAQTLDDDTSISFRIRYPFASNYGTITNNINTFSFTGIWGASNSSTLLIQGTSGGFDFLVNDVMLFDLTQMFGVGNEPTIEQFNTYFSNDYYEYITSEHLNIVVSNETVIYNDDDIMSQAVYQLYNAVDKYFNMGNVFNLNGVYEWFEVNILGGTSNIAMYIVWQIVLYEFVMDLLFLLYGLFMWFIDMLKRLMEKPLDSIK